MAPKPKYSSVPELFFARIEKQLDGCWRWTGSIADGYGVFYSPLVIGGTGKTTSAHQFSYEFFVGQMPLDADDLDHLCRNRWCVNWEHLEPVTHRINVLRGDGLAAKEAAQTHCKRGHAFTPENTYLRDGKVRVCRSCDRARTRLRADRVSRKHWSKAAHLFEASNALVAR